MSHILSDFFNLFFPKICVGCHEELLRGEKILCQKCLYGLPKTNYHKVIDNDIKFSFNIDSNITFAAAYCYYTKKGVFQEIIHNFKYKQQKQVGTLLGLLFGKDLAKTSHFQTIDKIVPVPLHARKYKKRGYNQSEYIARGLSKALDKPVLTDSLIRKIYTQTQTKKNAEERWENVKEAFAIQNTGQLKNQHILLVDDVLTTGSTLKACSNVILQVENTKVSIATLGIAQ